MIDLMRAEERNRKKLMDLANQIPRGTPPGWERNTLAVGGLMYIGFSERHPQKLICISSQGQSVIDCKTSEKTYCKENFNEIDLEAYAEELEDAAIRIAGEGGGGLRHFSKEGNSLERISPFWPRERIVFMPDFHSWYSTPSACRIVLDDYEIKAYGFSRCGNYFVIATSSDLTIFTKAN
nr:hypothetical protein [uncultured Acetatifactor sp.]